MAPLPELHTGESAAAEVLVAVLAAEAGLPLGAWMVVSMAAAWERRRSCVRRATTAFSYSRSPWGRRSGVDRRGKC